MFSNPATFYIHHKTGIVPEFWEQMWPEIDAERLRRRRDERVANALQELAGGNSSRHRTLIFNTLPIRIWLPEGGPIGKRGLVGEVYSSSSLASATRRARKLERHQKLASQIVHP